MKGTVPLARAMSKLGLMSRSEAAARILAGDVRVRGVVVRDPGHPVVPERARISVAGITATRATSITIRMHKPRGVVTTRRDPRGRPTVYDVLAASADVSGRSGASLPYLAPVGRLDLASTGLLLLTNNSRLNDWLLDPANQVPRTYIVTVRGSVADERVTALCDGIHDRGELLRATAVEILKRSERETHARVRLVEGRNRELRRLFGACGHEVTRLKRVSIGGLELGTLAPGKWAMVTTAELLAAFPRARHVVGRR